MPQQLVQKMTTTDAPKAIGPYSQAVLAQNFLFISGQLPIHPKTDRLAENHIRVQTTQVLDNIEAILRTCNLTFDDVIRTDIFLKDLNDFAIVNEIYGHRFTGTIAPARQTIQVSRLPLDSLVEISCIAFCPKGAPQQENKTQ